MWFSTVFPIHMSTVDCQVPSINNNWNNPDLWISVFCAQCYWPVVKILLSFDWYVKKKKQHSDKDLAFFLSNFTREKDSVIEIVERFLHGVHKCYVWYLTNIQEWWIIQVEVLFKKKKNEKLEGNIWGALYGQIGRFENTCTSKSIVFTAFQHQELIPMTSLLSE